MMKIECKLVSLIGDMERRENRRVSRERISLATGISQPTLSKIARNKSRQIRLETIAALCEFFNCGVEDLLELNSTSGEENE